MVTYVWFGHLGLFWYGLEVVLVRSTFQINSKCAFGVVICDFPPLLVWSMDLTRTEWPYYRKLCGIRVGVILTAARIWLGHFFASGMVTYFWFGHLGLFWYGLEVFLVRSTFQINSKFAFGVVIRDSPPTFGLVNRPYQN